MSRPSYSRRLIEGRPQEERVPNSPHPDEHRLVELASQINAEHHAAEKAAESAVEHAIRCGNLLLDARGRVPHGEWEEWLKENFDGSLEPIS